MSLTRLQLCGNYLKEMEVIVLVGIYFQGFYQSTKQEKWAQAQKRVDSFQAEM